MTLSMEIGKPMPQDKPRFPLLTRLGLQAWTVPYGGGMELDEPAVDAAELEALLKKHLTLSGSATGAQYEYVRLPLPCEVHVPIGGDSQVSNCRHCNVELVATWRPK